MRSLNFISSAALALVVASVLSTDFPIANAQELTEYKYDARGRLITTVDPKAHTDYALDKADNRETVQQRKLFGTSWLATALPHNVGYADRGGWAASVSNGSGHMTYGPYTTGVPVGSRVATWKMMIDVVDGANDNIVTIDVYDATADQILGAETIQRNEWHRNLTYPMFEVPFVFDASRAGHSIELRTWYHAGAYVRVQKIGY
jgi:YD repeat-containing protein